MAKLRPGAPSTLTHTPGTRSTVETASTTYPERNSTQQVEKFYLIFFFKLEISVTQQKANSPALNKITDETTTKLKSALHVCESARQDDVCQLIDPVLMSRVCSDDALFILPICSHRR